MFKNTPENMGALSYCNKKIKTSDASIGSSYDNKMRELLSSSWHRQDSGL
jgi:hypothetical protein